MCRLLSLINTPNELANEALTHFEELADGGSVPAETPKGHRDGWGIVEYRGGKVSIIKKGVGDASIDSAWNDAVSETTKNTAPIIIAHLRKVSGGAKSVENVHPFTKGIYALAHNGSIAESDKLAETMLAPAYRKLIKGSTETEKLLHYIVQLTSGVKTAQGARRAFIKAIAHVRTNHSYTAMNFIFSNGRYVWATREVNQKDPLVKEKKLVDYFSLYHGHDGIKKMHLISSEKLPLKDITWKKLPNHTLIEIDTKTGKAVTMNL